MLRSSMLLLIGLLIGLLWPATALAASFTYHASLAGANEFPPTASLGTGSANVVVDTTAHTLSIDIAFSDLVGPTTASHIHCCVSPDAATPTAGVATPTPTFPGFPTGVTSGSYSQVFDLTSLSSYNSAFVTANGATAAGAEAALTNGLADGMTYLNIHTSVFPGGEIRGFLVVVPEPSTATLLLLGLTGLAADRRRRTVSSAS